MKKTVLMVMTALFLLSCSNKKQEQTKVKASTAVTILLGKEDKVFYYFGIGTEEVDPDVKQTTYTPDGIRAVLLQRNQDVVMKIRELKAKIANRQISEEDFKNQAAEIKKDKQAPVVLIKSTDDASYKNMVDILDEMQICNISRYAIVDITDYDKGLIEKIENPVPQQP